MTQEKANELLKNSQQFIGQEIQVKTLDKASDKFILTTYKFTDTASLVWTVQNEKPTVDLWAKLETLDGQHKITLGLEKVVRHFEGKVLQQQPIQYVEVPLTFNGSTQTVYVAAIAAKNNTTGQNGFLACTFKVSDGVPTNPNRGNDISNLIYATQDEAIKLGTKLLNEQFKQKMAIAKKKK
jgi:hypothetical protein